MASHGIVPELSFVLGNPPDPEADAAGTIEFIRRVKRINPATEIILYLYTPVPLDGDLFEDAKPPASTSRETLDEWVIEDWLDFAQRRSRTVPWIRPAVQRRIRDFERVLNAYYPTTTMPTGGPRRSLLRGLGGATTRAATLAARAGCAPAGGGLSTSRDQRLLRVRAAELVDPHPDSVDLSRREHRQLADVRNQSGIRG